MSNPIKNAEKTVLVEKKICFISFIGNNLMMTLYFTCLLECTELLIDIFSSAAFLNSLFSEMATTNWL